MNIILNVTVNFHDHLLEYIQKMLDLDLCETRTVVIDAGKCMNLKITTYNIVFQKVEKNNFFSRRKSQLLL